MLEKLLVQYLVHFDFSALARENNKIVLSADTSYVFPNQIPTLVHHSLTTFLSRWGNSGAVSRGFRLSLYFSLDNSSKNTDLLISSKWLGSLFFKGLGGFLLSNSLPPGNIDGIKSIVAQRTKQWNDGNFQAVDTVSDLR